MTTIQAKIVYPGSEGFKAGIADGSIVSGAEVNRQYQEWSGRPAPKDEQALPDAERGEPAHDGTTKPK